METGSDTYLTVCGEAGSQFVEQRSRFISFVWHVTDADEVKERLAALQKEYYDARHICYAYTLGADRSEWRANDNGEPSGTAGRPILGQINSYGLTDILIAVVRYFGGVKLGTSGLAEAYRQAAQMAIEQATVVTRYVENRLQVLFNYSVMNEVMKVTKDLDLHITSQDYGSFRSDSPESDDSPVYECCSVFSARARDIAVASERLNRFAVTMREPQLECKVIG